MEECKEKFGGKRNGSLAQLVRAVEWVKCMCNQQVEQGEGASIEIQTSCLILADPSSLKCFCLSYFQQLTAILGHPGPGQSCSEGVVLLGAGGNLTEGRQQVNLPSTCLGVVSGLPSIRQQKQMSKRNGLFVQQRTLRSVFGSSSKSSALTQSRAEVSCLVQDLPT